MMYTRHEVAVILSEVFGDECACNFGDIGDWLGEVCDFVDTCCPNPVGVACWEQYLKHKELEGDHFTDADKMGKE